MIGRTLAIVERAELVGPPEPGRDWLVLDPWWSPGPETRADVRPLRPVARRILDEIDLPGSSIALLDDWAARAGLADRFMADGVCWWFRVRMTVRWDLQELMLWRAVLGHVAPAGAYGVLHVPADRTALLAAARALAATAAAAAPGSFEVIATQAPLAVPTPASLLARLRSRLRVRTRLTNLRHRLSRRPPPAQELVAARLAAVRATAPRVLALAWAGAYQVLGSGASRRMADPHLALVLDRLASEGHPVASLVAGITPASRAGRGLFERDRTALPQAAVAAEWTAPDDAAVSSEDVAGRVADAGATPLPFDGCDLAPALQEALDAHAGAWLDDQRRAMRRWERFLREIRPGAVYLDRDGTRTSWIAAARRAGVPVVSVQHGMIFPGNPEYIRPQHPAVPRPDVTCVFGTYERDLLLGHGYGDREVVVTGSPRLDPAILDQGAARAGRAEIRRSLGVRAGDRLLVVSVAHNPVGELHGAVMVERLLGGPLPGIHVVIKHHPQDRAASRYAALLAGLARAGGYAAPAVSAVRDIDLFALLGAADAHLSQYSTVLTDAAVAGTPSLIAVGQAHTDPLGYIAAGVAVPVRTVEEVRAFMADPRPPAAVARERFVDAHFARGDATARIAAVLLAASVAASGSDQT